MPKDKNIYTFTAGLPGLPTELNKFELVSLASDSPFFFLQSVQDETVCFILVNPFMFFTDYEFEITNDVTEVMDMNASEQLAVFCIVNAGKGLKDATVNLLAPVILNVATGKARQVVLVDKRYTIRHPLSVNKPPSEKEDK
ncbi:MAG: hypothetical protein VR69_11770 [Peptococcaceae bacterium BRH_c4b]|nr:MAG: hypothetical protein VR69_11770 [Peptococcaceae bacterium BRH_c4b]